VVAVAAVCLTLVVGGVWLVVGGAPGGSIAAQAYPAPHYVDEAQQAGISHTYAGEFEHYVGGGVAAFDCNSDGLIDLYFAGGSDPAALYVNRSPVGGALRFEELAGPVTDVVAVTGAYPLDIDSDGITDLSVLRRGENLLLRGLGDCRFESANEHWGFDGGDAWSTAFSARWDNGAAWPTIAIGNYLASTDLNDLACADNEVLTAAASGAGFSARTSLSPSWCTLSMVFSDWDRSGRRDLRVSNDRHYYSDYSDGMEQLWRIEAGQQPQLYGDEDGWRRLRVWGMGIASYDVTGDGYPEYYLTTQGDNKLQALSDGPTQPSYEDIALSRNATAHRPYAGDTTMPSTAWHDEFADVNNDGYVDLYISKGNVEAMAEYAARDPSNLLIGQVDGTFVEGALDAGIDDYARARGAALVDLNLDGMLDLVVVKRLENVRLFRNVGAGTADRPDPRGSWLGIKLAQTDVNRDAIGSWIEVRSGDRTQLRELTVGGGHVSGQLAPAHFGLGGASTAEFRVTWPDGELTPWRVVNVNQRLLIERGAPEPVVLQ
jgi:hypothetical protein